MERLFSWMHINRLEKEYYLDTVIDGDLEKLKEYITIGIPIDIQTALQYACENGHLNIVKYLIDECKGNKNTQNKDGWNLLHFAAFYGHIRIVKYLINDCQMDVSLQNNNGNNALHMSAYKGYIDVVMFLIEECQVNTYTTDNDGWNALHYASYHGYFIIVKYLIEDCKCDTKIQTKYESNALSLASQFGHIATVKYLIENCQMDMNVHNIYGLNALHYAASHGHLDIVKYLIQTCQMDVTTTNNDGKTAYDLATLYNNIDVADYLLVVLSGSNNKNTIHNDENDSNINHQQLDIVMNDPLSDPVEFGWTYLHDCTNHFTSNILCNGAFGKVFFGCDKALGVQIFVKCIPLHINDNNALDQVSLCLTKEISVLKRFRHPNIATLYGYNVSLNQENQFLVYEYHSIGVLSTFLMDEKGRTRLTSKIRVSIMFQLARTIHFLHTGGCDNLIIFHRDIQSGNICLSRDFTPKLIDCGLAKFAPDNCNIVTPGSVTPTILTSSGAMVFGTPGYICPIYARGQIQYTAACDVYSIGIVFAELITGCLQGGQSFQHGKSYGDFLGRYFKDDEDEPIENGWTILIRDSDVLAEWNPEVLELLCKIAVLCIASSPKRRISTIDLLKTLSEISSIEFATQINDIFTQAPNALQIHNESVAETIMTSDQSCVLCNRSQCTTISCSDGHYTCIECIEQDIQIHLGKSGTGVSCKCGKVFHDHDLFGKINVTKYNCYIRERELQKRVEEKLNDATKQPNTITNMNENNHEAVTTMIISIKSSIYRVLSGLSYIASNRLKECPTLIWIVPADCTAGNSAKDWIRWTKNATYTRYDIYFVCQHSFCVLDMKLEVEVPRTWLTQVGPVLHLGMLLLKTALSVGGLPSLPFPIPNVSRINQIKIHEEFVSSFLDDATMRLLASFQDAYCSQVSSNVPFDASSQLQSLADVGYEAIVAKANKGKCSQWKQAMQPVVNHHGSIIWIKNEYSTIYACMYI